MAASAPHGDRFLVGELLARRQFVRVWRDFREDQIAHDFATAKAFGIDLIRFFLTWETSNPAPMRSAPASSRTSRRSSPSPTVYGCG